MLFKLSFHDVQLIWDCIDSKIKDISILRFCGGDLGDSISNLISDLIDLSELFAHCMPLDDLIGVADVEASSQDSTAAMTKCTASDLDQREAGDKVSLDQHVKLYREVF